MNLLFSDSFSEFYARNLYYYNTKITIRHPTYLALSSYEQLAIIMSNLCQ